VLRPASAEVDPAGSSMDLLGEGADRWRRLPRRGGGGCKEAAAGWAAWVSLTATTLYGSHGPPRFMGRRVTGRRTAAGDFFNFIFKNKKFKNICRFGKIAEMGDRPIRPVGNIFNYI